MEASLDLATRLEMSTAASRNFSRISAWMGNHRNKGKKVPAYVESGKQKLVAYLYREYGLLFPKPPQVKYDRGKVHVSGGNADVELWQLDDAVVAQGIVRRDTERYVLDLAYALHQKVNPQESASVPRIYPNVDSKGLAVSPFYRIFDVDRRVQFLAHKADAQKLKDFSKRVYFGNLDPLWQVMLLFEGGELLKMAGELDKKALEEYRSEIASLAQKPEYQQIFRY